MPFKVSHHHHHYHHHYHHLHQCHQNHHNHDYHHHGAPVEAVAHYSQLRAVPPETHGGVESLPGHDKDDDDDDALDDYADDDFDYDD